MSLKLIHKATTYKEYLNARNGSKGICTGIAIDWIVDIMGNKISRLGPPEPFYGEGRARHKSYYNFFDSRRIWQRYDTEAAYAKQVFKNELGLPTKTSGSIVTNSSLKRMLLRVPEQKGANVSALLNWKFGGGGHAVAIFKNKADQQINFYDPNFGVYEWSHTNLDLYYEIKLHMRDVYSKTAVLQNVAVVETNKELNVNRPHVVI